MPRIKTTERSQKLDLENQNYVCNNKLNDAYNSNSYNNNNLQHSENSSGELQSDAASSRFETESDSESTQNSHRSFHENSNEQLPCDKTCETASYQFEAEAASISESIQKNHTSFHENFNEQMQWDQTCETASGQFETEADSESTQNSHTSFHENFNELQWDQTCEAASSRFEIEADSISESTQSNPTNFQSSPDCETDFKSTQNCLAYFQIENSQIHECRKDTNELPQNAEDFEDNQDFKPNILLDIKIESPDHESNSKECQNFPRDLQQDENDPSDSVIETISDIKTKTCDMISDSVDAQDSHEHSQLANGLQIKSEPCDINSDHLVPEGCKEIKSESFESSNEACDREIDHSSCSSRVEIKSEKPDVENDVTSLPNQDLKRSRRNSKRKREMEDRCPICGLTVRYADLESHFAKEIENLSNIPKNVRKNRASYKNREGFRCGVNLGFVQAKCNRENRLAARRAKYSKKQAVFCPICKIRISGSDEEMNDHVLRCFGEDDDSDINVTDFDYDEAFEEYEIGDETRVRAISLVPGGHSALHGYSSKSKSTNDEDDGVDVNVDVDDTVAFGEPQYTELDVIHNTIDASNEKEEQLRRAVVSDPSAEPHIIEGKKWSRDCDIQNDIDEIIGSCVKNKLKEEKSREENEDMKMEKNSKEDANFQNAESNIISSLKEKIKDLEQQKNVKCLICLEPYTRPVVSTTCWHVHCEECWLVSMGVKKLCPQCNMIVFPTDLRRIYL